ncbi:class I SAM-dependent methyltransferase [Paludisphaera rhizosphaerae]|uniref:class I SAM-dependent methyltransferase n=1 Tax=Paludisphaera rhizosphaerae TaxID=2711216 RepID=UPI0013EC3CAC|nr:class I SAM-dependent methyltransferase [Paludisphaera rhizosphaerae]
MTTTGRLLAAALLTLLASPDSRGQQPPKEPPAESKPDQAKARRPVRSSRPGMYKGRRIADVMSWQGAEWLFRETRVEEEQPEAMLDALKIEPGMTVADVGAGAGYHTVRLARRVGEKGLVLATDVQREMIDMLKDNVRDAGARNVRPLLCTQRDTKLPAGEVDLILMVDVYHECTNPETLLDGLLAALKPGGRLVLVEFRGEDPQVPIKPEHKMTLEQARLEVEPRGFAFKTSHEFLPWQHVIVFEKPLTSDAPARPTPPQPSGSPGGDPKP